MRRGTKCEVMDQRRRLGASSAAGAPACPHSAAVESAEARLPTRELAGRAASSAAGAPASGPGWNDDVGDYWLSSWIDVIWDWPGPRRPLRAAPSAAEAPAASAAEAPADRGRWRQEDATGAKSAGKGSQKSQPTGTQHKADHYAGNSGVLPSKGGAYWPTDAGGYGGHIHADVSLPSALTTTFGISCTTPVFCARLYKMGIA
jgi:hypothetical protein